MKINIIFIDYYHKVLSIYIEYLKIKFGNFIMIEFLIFLF